CGILSWMYFGNQTSVTEFIILGFRNLPELQILLFVLFLVIYIVTMVGNLLVVLLVVIDEHLHTPMYFFLGNLSCLETAYSSNILPRMLASLLTEDRAISLSGCIAQLYFFGFLATTECYLLAVMSYDRYLAICKPLHYATLMSGSSCLLLVALSWISGFLVSAILIGLISQLTFCGPNHIDHFFCDFTPLTKLSCSNTQMVVQVALTLSSVDTLPPFLITLTSYVYIITSILRIPSTTGRQKAFSTCSSHLAVVACFYGSLTIVYVLPNPTKVRDPKKIFSVFYTILTPMFNPLIYTLRNREVHKALKNNVLKCLPPQAA
uniref:Olfactory receptor n=1 Tax=Sphenodon punctatus TaxID=8508 RepID=A0A8D0L8N7_SPHPU